MMGFIPLQAMLLVKSHHGIEMTQFLRDIDLKCFWYLYC